jgi:hypothetical protein
MDHLFDSRAVRLDERHRARPRRLAARRKLARGRGFGGWSQKAKGRPFRSGLSIVSLGGF